MRKFIIVGNPNTGKTTIFNELTKSNEKTGNWHGVTVSEKVKRVKYENEEIEVVDLPGIYSMEPLSFEEEVATNYIKDNLDATIVFLADNDNIIKNSYLLTELMEYNLNIIFVINQMNKKIINKINIEKLKNKLNINNIILFNKNNKKEIKSFKQKVFNAKINNKYNLFYLKEINKDINIENKSKIKFNYLKNIYNDCIERKNVIYGQNKIDKILLNKFLAIPIFFGIMFLIFYLTFFSLGAWISSFFSYLIQDVIGGKLIEVISSLTSVEWVVEMFSSAIVGGIGSLVSFLPQICLLFLFLAILEDSGYLSRIAFMFEDYFVSLGLSGKSVYTLLMGFGCSTTAALTARNMEDKNAKIKTALLTPYMSCSAKLPIYAVIGGAFFVSQNVFIVFCLYLLGVVVALLISLILEKWVLKSKEQSFILEFPAYRLPNLKRVMNLIGTSVKQFLVRIGGLLISLNIIIWLISSFSFRFEYVLITGEKSMLQTIAEFIAPIFAPLGFGNWGAVGALIVGIVAKEIIVSSIAMFNGINDNVGENVKIQIQRSIIDTNSVVFFTPSSALSYLVFCLLYSPCIATISVFRTEIGRKWTFISIITQLIIAYILAFVVYNLSNMFINGEIANAIFWIIGIFAILISLVVILTKFKTKNFCNSCKNCDRNCKKKISKI